MEITIHYRLKVCLFVFPSDCEFSHPWGETLASPERVESLDAARSSDLHRHSENVCWRKVGRQRVLLSCTSLRLQSQTLVLLRPELRPSGGRRRAASGTLGAAAAPKTFRHRFPLSRLFHVHFALQSRSWGKTDASSAATAPLTLLTHSPPRPPHSFFSLPHLSAPWAFFMAGLSNTWPLPCIRPHVHIQTQWNETRTACDKVPGSILFFASFGLLLLRSLFEVHPAAPTLPHPPTPLTPLSTSPPHLDTHTDTQTHTPRQFLAALTLSEFIPLSFITCRCSNPISQLHTFRSHRLFNSCPSKKCLWIHKYKNN